MITSAANPKVRYAQRLAERRFRQREERVVLEGVRLIAAALDAGARPAFSLVSADLLRTPGGHELSRRLSDSRAPLLAVAPELLAATITDTATPQGVAVVFPTPALTWPTTPQLMVTLDGLQDPGNVGTLLRSAAAAGANAACLAPGTADPHSPKALRAGMGAQFRLPVRSGSWAQITEWSAGLITVGADAHAAVDHTSFDWRRPVNLIVGSEAHGLSDAARAASAVTVRIAMAAAAESLNAAAAGAVLLFEAARQRRDIATG